MTKKSELIKSQLDRKTFEVWVHLDSRHLEAFSELPTELIGNARLLLAGVKSRGEIDSFELFEELFEKVWERFTRKDRGISAVTFVIAQGYPKMEGVTISRGVDEESSLGYLTMSAPKATMARWDPSWLIRHVAKEIKKQGVSTELNSAQIHCLWLHASINGEPIRRAGFGAGPTQSQIPEGKDYSVRVFRSRQEVDIYFASFKSFRTQAGIDKLLLRVNQAVYRLATDPGGSGYYLLLKQHIETKIHQCREGIQALGINLPYSLLGAVTLRAMLLEGDIVKGIPPGSGSLFVSIMREMMALDGAKFNQDWFASRFLLPIANDSIQELMAILKNRGLVERQPKSDDWSISPSIVFVGYRICGRKCDDFHRTALHAAAGALATVDSVRFNFHATRFCISEEMSTQMIEAIKTFREETVMAARKLTSYDQVYQINMQFFPITRMSPDYRAISLEKHRHAAEAGAGPWINPIMYDLAGTENFRLDPKWAAGKLIPAINIAQAEASMEALKAAGYIVFDPIQNKYLRPKTDSKPVEINRGDPLEFDQKMIDLAAAALELDLFSRREFSTMVLSMTEDYAEKVRGAIKDLHRTLFDLAAKSLGADQVYQLNLQMFPHTK